MSPSNSLRKLASKLTPCYGCVHVWGGCDLYSIYFLHFTRRHTVNRRQLSSKSDLTRNWLRTRVSHNFWFSRCNYPQGNNHKYHDFYDVYDLFLLLLFPNDDVKYSSGSANTEPMGFWKKNIGQVLLIVQDQSSSGSQQENPLWLQLKKWCQRDTTPKLLWTCPQTQFCSLSWIQPSRLDEYKLKYLLGACRRDLSGPV